MQERRAVEPRGAVIGGAFVEGTGALRLSERPENVSSKDHSTVFRIRGAPDHGSLFDSVSDPDDRLSTSRLEPTEALREE